MLRRTTDEQILVGAIGCRENDALNPVESRVSLLKRKDEKRRDSQNRVVESSSRRIEETETNRERPST